MFLSRQRADLKDLGCPRGQETQPNRENEVFNESVIWQLRWLLLGSPGLVLAPLAPRLVLELWAAPRAALGWPWLLPPPSPKSPPSNETQNGQLHKTLPLDSEFSRQPGVHQQMHLT